MCRVRVAGFSLVELMVAVGIVGILVMLAMPRYQAFMVQSRRGEAKSNLYHIGSLQEVYKIDHFNYYYGNTMTGSNGIGYRYGRWYGQHACASDKEIDQGLCNWLGFQPDNVGELRYLYRLTDQGRRAVAGAASDADGRWIYPECRGDGATRCGSPTGDVVAMNVKGKAEVCRNITEYCPQGGGRGSFVIIPPPPPQCDTATQCCPDGATGTPVTACTRGGGWTFSATAPPAPDGCCACNVSCSSGEYLGSDCVCHPVDCPIPPCCTQSNTVCCPDGATGAPVTACTKGGNWQFNATQANCCSCSLTPNSCEKGEWLSEECKCSDCGTCPYLKVHTTRGSCNCECEKTEQQLCEDSGYTWGASCDCTSLHNSYYTWSRVGDCYYSCSCNVSVLRANCARLGKNTNTSTCDCETSSPICDPSTQCCTGNRETVSSDCTSGEMLRPHPDCCTATTGLNILTVRSACILTDAQSLLRSDGGRFWDILKTSCGGSASALETITTVDALTAECGMNNAGIIPAIEGMYSCFKREAGYNPNRGVQDTANARMIYIRGAGNCNITGNATEIAREPNKCTVHIPPP